MEDRDGVGDRRRAVEPPDAGTARLDGSREPLPFDAASGHAAPPELARVKVREQVADASEVVGMRVRHGDRVEPEDLADRKSTRLNSSHVSISYAVFCLK